VKTRLKAAKACNEKCQDWEDQKEKEEADKEAKENAAQDAQRRKINVSPLFLL